MGPKRDERPLGERAVEKGWLERGALEAALESHAERLRRGERVSLGRHLVEMGLLEPGKVREILAEQEKEIVLCSNPACGRRYNLRGYRADRTYRCKACGARLAAPGVDRETAIAVEDEAGESASSSDTWPGGRSRLSGTRPGSGPRSG